MFVIVLAIGQDLYRYLYNVAHILMGLRTKSLAAVLAWHTGT
jgi:hypothetical protein